jgi:hypothetical protein
MNLTDECKNQRRLARRGPIASPVTYATYAACTHGIFNMTQCLPLQLVFVSSKCYVLDDVWLLCCKNALIAVEIFACRFYAHHDNLFGREHKVAKMSESIKVPTQQPGKRYGE